MPNATRDYGDRAYGRRPTLGAVMHGRAMDALIREKLNDEKTILEYFKLKKPVLVTLADRKEWQRRLRRLKRRYAAEVLQIDLQMFEPI